MRNEIIVSESVRATFSNLCKTHNHEIMKKLSNYAKYVREFEFLVLFQRRSGAAALSSFFFLVTMS